VEQEVRLEYVKREGIEVNRRITGGGAIYFDELQIGWEIIADRKSFGNATYEEITRAICEAAAKGLRKLGVKASFRPRNDIEVEGRKFPERAESLRERPSSIREQYSLTLTLRGC